MLVVKGALGEMGAGNTAVLMQLLVGMLDAALARQQDLVAAEQRMAVALKVDEAPLVLNRGFAETLALKRSAGLETVACWQTDAQWSDARGARPARCAVRPPRVLRDRVGEDARAAASLLMAEFSDSVRAGVEQRRGARAPGRRVCTCPGTTRSRAGAPPEGRQAPFMARTIPLRVDPERIALHAARQPARGGRHLADLAQPHWDRRGESGRVRAGRRCAGSGGG